MHEPPAAGARTGSALASSIAASAALLRGIRPPPLPFSSSAAQTALKSRGRERGLSLGTVSSLSDPRERCCASLRVAPAGEEGCRAGERGLVLESQEGAVLRNESMCNYTDNLPCPCLSMRDFFFLLLLVSFFGERRGVHLFLLHISVVLGAHRSGIYSGTVVRGVLLCLSVQEAASSRLNVFCSFYNRSPPFFPPSTPSQPVCVSLSVLECNIGEHCINIYETIHHLTKLLHKKADLSFLFIDLILREKNCMLVLLMEPTEKSLD